MLKGALGGKKKEKNGHVKPVSDKDLLKEALKAAKTKGELEKTKARSVLMFPALRVQDKVESDRLTSASCMHV